jgi:hypothetical protein
MLQPNSYTGCSLTHTQAAANLIHGLQPTSYTGCSLPHTQAAAYLMHSLKPTSYTGCSLPHTQAAAYPIDMLLKISYTCCSRMQPPSYPVHALAAPYSTSYTCYGQHHTHAEVYRIHRLQLLRWELLLQMFVFAWCCCCWCCCRSCQSGKFSPILRGLSLVFAPCNPSCFIAGHFLLSLYISHSVAEVTNSPDFCLIQYLY